jgi:hypothetical protein
MLTSCLVMPTRWQKSARLSEPIGIYLDYLSLSYLSADKEVIDFRQSFAKVKLL